MWLGYSLIIACMVLSILAIYIYLISKKDAYKFFYPALVLFILFSFVPISYSIYVSFTNLQTGHLLERQKVVELFKEEKVLKPKSEFLSFQLFRDGENYFLVTDLSTVRFKLDQENINLLVESNLPSTAQLLNKADIMDVITKFPDLVFEHPALGQFSFYRTDILAQTETRYIPNGQSFIDRLTGKELVEDKVSGKFLLNGEPVGPGYYTTVGFKNYSELFFSEDTKFVFFKAFGWTVVWALGSVLLSFSFGAFLAVMLSELNSRSKLLFRLLFIIPYSIPFFISVLVFKGMLNKDFGEVNSLLSFFKISPVPWLENKIWARISVLMVNLWLGFPYMLLVITGILQSIPKSIYEASSLEGATRFQNFKYLTFPLVLKAMVPLLIGSFAFNFNNFVGIYLLTGGGPVIPDVSTPIGETDILISYTYRLAFEGSQGQNFATAAAISVFIFILIVALTFINFRVSKKLSRT